MPVKLGEQAKRNYETVKYFPFGNEAGSSYILTSDPYNYLNAWLDSCINDIQRDRSKKIEKLKKAKYFSELSEGFYHSFNTARMPAKATLLYYSLVNLVKVYLLVEGYDLETKLEHHGISLPSNSELELKLIKPTSGEGISIFHEFGKTIGVPIDNSKGLEIQLNEILQELPEVHEIGHALKLFGVNKRKFLPVNIVIRTDEKRKKLYYTLSFEKKFEKQMATEKLEGSGFRKKLERIESEDSSMNLFRSHLCLAYTNSSEKSWKMQYPKLVANINDLNIATLITRAGYRNYLNLKPGRFHRLSSVLAFTFYLGTVARYRPSLNNTVLRGKFQPVILEAINSCPNQFLYHIVSYITKQVCAVPMAKID